ncbi:hypothetical protein CFO_g3919 [Ceratocystis platani]|uniref:Infection structure specific protein n=1 Tax=Ceratocystis fimbriata f. sp. platani TaxID=88771 RepID=A0A0F8AZ54_CERFI|nr:hypothetical protein CFO_g3919 [Ceratocystis platani]
MHYLKSLLALTASVATVSAMAAPHPMITPAPKMVRMRRDIFDDLGNVIEDGANNVADSVEDAANDIADSAEDAANDIADGVDDIGNDISRWGSSIFTNAEQSATCISLASALVDSNPPRPTEDLRDLLEDSQSASGHNCLTSVPASLTSEYSAYETSAVNWYSSASSLISSYQASCPTFGDLNVQRLVPCSTISGMPAITSGGSASGSSRTSGASSTSSSTVTGSAPRNGGLAAGALVALVGVIALF